MSNCNNQICRDSYFNYGSYLRSRGYDKEICNLVTAIENGQIPIGGLNPGPGGVGLTVTGNIIVNPSDAGNDGQVIINGGSYGKYLPDPTQAVKVAQSQLGLQAKKGAHILGPIVQRASGHPSYVQNTGMGVPVAAYGTNLFEGNYHVFQGPDAASTELHVKGNIILDGSGMTTVDELAETLTLETVLPFPASGTAEPDVMLRLFATHVATSSNSAANGKDLIDVWLDSSTNIINAGHDWRSNNGLAFAIDGRPTNPQVDASYGGTGIPGHARALRGLTATSAPINNIDISYSVDPLDLSGIAIDAYGTIRISEGPTIGTGKAPGNLDLSGGDINFYVGGAAPGSLGYIRNTTTGTGSYTDLSMGKGYFTDLSAGGLQVLGDTVLGTNASTDTVTVHGDLTAQTLIADTSLSVLNHATIGNNSNSTKVALEVTKNGSQKALVVTGDASFNNGVAIGGVLRVFDDASFNKDVHIKKDLIVTEDVSCGLHLYVGHQPGVGDATIYRDLSAGWGTTGQASGVASLRVQAATPNVNPVGSTGAQVFIGDGTVTLPTGTAQQSNVRISNTGQLTAGTSSLRYKNNIRDLELTDAKRLMNIRARKFNYIDGSAIPRMGFIAEEFHDAGLQEFVIYDAGSRPNGINYEEITAPLLEIARDNLDRVILLEGELKEAKERIAALEKK